MPDKSRNANYSRIILLILIAIAMLIALQHYFLIDFHGKVRYSIWWHIPFNLGYWLFWYPLYPLLSRYLSRERKPSGKMRFWFVLYVFLPFFTLFLHQFLATVSICSLLPGFDFQVTLYKRLIRNQWLWMDFSVYFSLVILVQIESYKDKIKNQELLSLKLEGQVAQSYLRTLKSQLHPHFLFNTLNTLSTFILEPNNAEAERVLGLITEFLRTTIYSSDKPAIALREELRFIRNYLAIERVRFPDALSVEEKIAPEVLEAEVPNFLLQPLVENAIHHAIAVMGKNGLIRITAKKELENLTLSIEDNGPGISNLPHTKKKPGVGLKITRQRLQYLYGSRYVFSLGNSDLGGLKVSVEIPFMVTP